MADLDLDKLEADAKIRREELIRIMRSVNVREESIAYGTRVEDAILALIERLRAAEAKLEAVRDMHFPTQVGFGSDNEFSMCDECNTAWPCETIEALGEES